MKTLKISEAVGDIQSLAYCLNNIGGVYVKKKNYKYAESFCKRSLQYAKTLGYPQNIRNASRQLCRIYKALGKYKDAYEMHVLFKQMSDSINNTETQKASVKKQMQYDFDKKESQMKMDQEKKDVIEFEEKEKQKIVRNSFITGFTFVFLVALIIFRGYHNKQKANITITKQKDEVEKSKFIIEEQKMKVEEKQKEILDSIHYAKRIQTALITSEKYINKNLEKLNA